MNTLTRNLPSEIQLIIISFIPSCQPKSLCDDIKSFYKAYRSAKETYHQQWRHSQPDLAEDWLVNDTVRFMNRDVPTIYGYQDYYKNIIKRHFSMKNKNDQEIDELMGQIDEYGGEENNNLFKISLGLMTPKERNALLKFFDSYQITDT